MNRLLLRRSTPLTSTTAGFTLMEMIVVVVMIGILGAIAAPSWLNYMNARRMDAARNQILEALRTAQSEASRRKQSQQVVFTTNPPTVKVLGNTEPLGQGEIQPGTVKLTAKNGGADVTQIRFNASGNLVDPADPAKPLALDGQGLKITVSTSMDGAKRCVVIVTLLGAMRSDRDTGCN